MNTDVIMLQEYACNVVVSPPLEVLNSLCNVHDSEREQANEQMINYYTKTRNKKSFLMQ